ncbi:uncharacterized protein L201_004289 [Kwoniella dendrophila CBS 6074]|uniref:Uncharacterized protein n=1 Tax=Kwoniella dendrophila CBS 6074 TaxID=1295534 RepID=A0AAX4JVB5_9TREE
MSSMSSPINDTSMLPTGAQGAQPGVQNTSTSSTGKKDDMFAMGGNMSGHTGVPVESGYEHHHNPFKHPHDSCEAEPGTIENTHIAPLNEGLMAEDIDPEMFKNRNQQNSASRTSKNM